MIIHCVVSIDYMTTKIIYLSSHYKAEQAYADAMIYMTQTDGIWHTIVDKESYINDLLNEKLTIKPCPLQG